MGNAECRIQIGHGPTQTRLRSGELCRGRHTQTGKKIKNGIRYRV